MENRPWQRHYDYNVPLTIRYPRIPAHHFLNIPAGSFPDRPATNFYGTEITFWDLRQQVLRMANALAGMGVKKGDRVGVHLPNCPQYMGINYGEGWGMSETTSLGIPNPLLGLKKAGSIGIPFPDTDARVVDIAEGEADVAQGQPGELIIRSPLTMKEYWNNPQETAGQLKNGWLYTGDIVVQDEDDYFAIVDRKKDMIIAGGYNVYPREIDEVLYQHPKIADAVAVGIPDEYRGETLKAFVVAKTGETLTEDDVIGFCREKLAAYKTPKMVEFRTELPKSAVGKILREVLREEGANKVKK